MRELPLYLESFESTVLRRVRDLGIRGSYVYLLESSGSAYDLVATHGRHAPTYAEQAAPGGLDVLAGIVDGISVDKRMILAPDRLGRAAGPSRVVGDAHARGLRVFTWTCRPENAFLTPSSAAGGERRRSATTRPSGGSSPRRAWTASSQTIPTSPSASSTDVPPGSRHLPVGGAGPREHRHPLNEDPLIQRRPPFRRHAADA